MPLITWSFLSHDLGTCVNPKSTKLQISRDRFASVDACESGRLHLRPADYDVTGSRTSPKPCSEAGMTLFSYRAPSTATRHGVGTSGALLLRAIWAMSFGSFSTSTVGRFTD